MKRVPTIRAMSLFLDLISILTPPKVYRTSMSNSSHGEKRVLLVILDVHEGTKRIFYDKVRVSYRTM